MDHIHTLTLDVPRSNAVHCEGCGIQLRLATYDEAVFIETTNGFAPEGPMNGPGNTIVVPVGFSLFQEA